MIEEDQKTLWCGNVSEQVTEELLYELFVQAGPLERVRIAKNRDGRQKNFAFITYCHEVSVPYALNLFRGTALFHRTLTLQSRGRATLLPPPIRCYGPDPMLDLAQANVTQQFADMAENIREEDHRPVYSARQPHDMRDKLVLASLQGNWSHRHHPYMPKDMKSTRDDYRPRDNFNENHRANHNKHHGNWRDRRSHKKGGYHRREYD